MNKIYSLTKNIVRKLSPYTTLKEIPSILNPIPPVYELTGIELKDMTDEFKQNAKIVDNLYIKNKIFENKNFTAYLILWHPKATSPIHNHGTLGCFYKPLTKGMVEHQYLEKEDYLHYIKRKECCPTYTHYINDYIGLHCMENTNDYISSSIHIYPNNDTEETN